MTTKLRLWAAGIGAVVLLAVAVVGQLAEVQLLEERPAWGSFYSLQKTNEPPLPFNPFPELPLYGFGLDCFAYDDRLVDYVALQQERLAWQLLSQATTESLLAEGYEMESMDSGPPSPGPGEPGGTNDPPSCDPPLFLTSTGLCLLPPVFLSSNSITLTLTNGEANAQYDLFGTTNLMELALPALSLTNWLWLVRGEPGQTAFTLTNVPLPESYYALGTMLDSDADGLTDAYEMWVSHTDPFNPDTDGDGWSDYYEVFYGLPPGEQAVVPTLSGVTLCVCPLP
jgi:hypothetical protein